MARNYLTFTQQKAVEKALAGLLLKQDNGTVKYREGASDQYVAELMSFECSQTNVASVRRAAFGDMYLRKPKPPIATTSAIEVEALEEQVERLKLGLAGWRDRALTAEKSLDLLRQVLKAEPTQGVLL